jgi:two-component system, chemotaxis family, chemotaxis protein CheY
MKKILIVDDSAFTRNIHKKIVENEGYRTVEASNGSEALAVFAKEKPDLTIVDLLMPDMDGMEVVKNILKTDPIAKIFICSSDKQKYRREEAKAMGVLEFITKPISDEKMVGALNKILKD